jgi:tetratricopeptide (TPR) repeat protein
MWLALSAWAGLGGAAPGGTFRSGLTDAGRTQDQAASLLVEYFRRFLADQDFDAFRDRVDARYSEDTLCRLLADSPEATTRRAAVLALGSLGQFPRSNPVLGRALRDSDPVVRRLAEDALWSLWFRADAPDNNQALRQVRQLLGRGEMNRAEALATRLIAIAPRFAEAYNQRAIIYFEQGRFAESAQDCQRVLSINPYHFGALSGLAQCELRQNRPLEAIKALRRASKLQPYNLGLRDSIRFLEAQVELDQS